MQQPAGNYPAPLIVFLPRDVDDDTVFITTTAIFPYSTKSTLPRPQPPAAAPFFVYTSHKLPNASAAFRPVTMNGKNGILLAIASRRASKGHSLDLRTRYRDAPRKKHKS